MNASTQYTQFGRAGSLIVNTIDSQIDLSQLRFTFEVRASDVDTPNTLVCKVYNPSANTANEIFTKAISVTLRAGYQNGAIGQIFTGDVKQVKLGRERNVDNCLTIYAADGDQAYNQSVINMSFPAGATPGDQLSKVASAMGIPVDKNAENILTAGGILPNPRGKVAFGMARVFMDGLARNSNSRWSIQNGTLTFVPNTGYLPGPAIAINSASGMIGVPEQTDGGIMVRCLLNPLIKIGQAIQINNQDIAQTSIRSQGYPNYKSLTYLASVGKRGLYRVLVAEHFGDTRGQGDDWCTELTCLDIDPSSSASTSVAPGN